MRKLFIIIIFIFLSTSLTALDSRYEDVDFSKPENVSKYVFNFFHHSCGGNLLGDGLANGLSSIGYQLHSRINETYIYENNYTDYRHWYKRFQRELGIKSGNNYYQYNGPDADGSPKSGPIINSNEFMLYWYEFASDEGMDIIMFKPCYPGSHISSYDTQYDSSDNNNGYGQVTSGTPHSDDNANNFTYLNSSASVNAGYDNSIWGQGTWNSSDSSLAQLKCAYRGMLNIFKEHPDILFIALQGPPEKDLTAEEAANCRELARWFREDWLHQYDPKGQDKFKDYPLYNVAPFDFQNSVGRTGNNSSLDDEYLWYPVGDFPDNTLDPDIWGRIIGEGQGAGADNHPNTWLNQRVAAIFCGGKDTYSNPETGMTQRTYNSWINGIVNRWQNPPLQHDENKIIKDRDIICYPTCADLNSIDSIKISVPSLKNEQVTVKICTIHGTLIKEIINAKFSNSVYELYLSEEDKNNLGSGTYIIKINNLKTLLMTIE